MTETGQLFASLEAEPQPLFAHSKGALHFEVLDNGERCECWHVVIDHGTVVVTREHADGDTIVTLEKPLFDDIACGRANAMAAAIRGEIGITGRVELLNRFQRVFPGPDDAPSADEARA